MYCTLYTLNREALGLFLFLSLTTIRSLKRWVLFRKSCALSFSLSGILVSSPKEHLFCRAYLVMEHKHLRAIAHQMKAESILHSNLILQSAVWCIYCYLIWILKNPYLNNYFSLSFRTSVRTYITLSFFSISCSCFTKCH